METWPNHRLFTVALVALGATAGVWAGVEALHARWFATAAMSFACATAVAALLLRDRLPAFLGLLLAVAALVNAAGYVLGLWHKETSFDEIVHFYTSFAGLAAIAWFAVQSRWDQAEPIRLVALLGGAGLAIGVIWR